jgi:hypothetical protein
VRCRDPAEHWMNAADARNEARRVLKGYYGVDEERVVWRCCAAIYLGVGHAYASFLRLEMSRMVEIASWGVGGSNWRSWSGVVVLWACQQVRSEAYTEDW